MKTLQSKVIILFFFISFSIPLCAKVLHVGSNQEFESIEAAASIAQAGDKILVHNGIYSQRESLFQLQGEEDNPILIIAEETGKVIYQGMSEAWHLSSCSHLFIHGFVFQQQTANGVNIDDSGQDDASTHHIIIDNCVFRDMNATGNNDQLKLSGLYNFEIRSCSFLNGSSGGSGIDMVGCHFGLFENNRFNNMGSNCIQAKGGTQDILIRFNTFTNGGQRSLNLGGSTGLAYFRPLDAPFEAADILVHSNVFVGGWAPIAFVGSVRVNVVNNTIYKPENWVFRILQETVDTTRFEACGDNEFSNNIIYFGDNLHRIFNVGPNTRPESFLFTNNLWCNFDDDSFNDPQLPAPENNALIQLDPIFKDAANEDFELLTSSPAIGKGLSMEGVDLDFKQRYFASQPSIGAYEPHGVFKDYSGKIGTEWWYSYDFGYRLFRIDEKTIENEQEQSVLYYFVHVGDATGEEAGPDFYQNDRRFYFKDSKENDFSLLYDFNLEKGDTMYSRNGYLVSSIDSVGFEYLAGKVRKVLYTLPIEELSSYDLNFGLEGKIIEGIYSINTKMEGNEYYELGPDSNFFEKLRCFIEKDVDGDIEHEIHFQEGACDSITLSSQDQFISTIDINPNPVRNSIDLDIPPGKYQYQVFGIRGELMIENNWDRGAVDVTDLPAGYYILRIFESNKLWIGRFVKLNE